MALKIGDIVRSSFLEGKNHDKIMNQAQPMYKIFFVMILIVSQQFFGCKHKSNLVKQEEAVIKSRDSLLVRTKYNSEGIRFSKFYSDKYWRFNEYKRWNLTTKEALEADSIMVDCIRHSNETTKYMQDNINKYIRQYFGVDMGGAKVVWINCFIESPLRTRAYWMQELVDVDDGGDRHYNICIDIVNNKFFDLRKNGN
jgi:hypothetical protein